MIRQKLILVAFVPAMAVLALSACSRAADDSDAQGLVTAAPTATEQSDSLPATTVDGAEQDAAVDPGPSVTYAEVTNVKAVTVAETIRGTVTGVEELAKTSTSPQQVCKDVVVEERLPERDGLAGGTVVGAVVGGALGNQVGKGDGRKLATVAGAIAGGYAGREIDRRKDGGKVVTRTEQQCATEDVASTVVTGYRVTYQGADGKSGTRTMENAPQVGSRIDLGSTRKTVGYDVTYLYEGEKSTVRMSSRPGERLPVVDGQVVLDSRPISQG